MTRRRSAPSLLLALALSLGLGGCGAVESRAVGNEARAEALHPPQGRFVTVGGRRVHYVQSGHGPDLVLIHGASGSTRDFTFRFMGRVSDRYRVTAFDRPGLGYTDPDPRRAGAADRGAESPSEQAALLAAAARAIGLRRPIVLGHSYGGAVAIAWVLQGEASALVVVSGVTQPFSGGPGPLYALGASGFGGRVLAPLATAYAGPAQIEAAARAIFSPNPVPQGYLQRVGAPLTLRRDSLRANLRQVDALDAWLRAARPLYGAIDIPVEIVHGTRDAVVPFDAQARPLAAEIPGARLTPLRDVGHMPHQIAPGAVARAVDRAAARAGLR